MSRLDIIEMTKIVSLEIAMSVIIIIGFICWQYYHNSYALALGLASSVAFLIFNVFVVCFLANNKKGNKNE